ncbi:histidinol dehydrogenase [Flavitalea sp. BT771]|uniref:histidinol dehydrogenase n=1 Tax=Flavitalea sp. BT771 TaxID=3063329 RepID=UPI0026E3FBDD|nr:histidinol dehydrogenase [Flavitalea sp. BT771]MDO6432398.1 histidinol dehydrogenase [Flavitalea sp. BT771]MDV6221308.1 histidinol dehydrogenase [Flavitalea sp. BT771]
MQLIDISSYDTLSPAQRREWLSRPVLDTTALEQKVADILSAVKRGGDTAVKAFSLQFDKVSPEHLEVGNEEMEAAVGAVGEELQLAIRQALRHIQTFHNIQRQPVEAVETMPGVQCWRKSVAIEKVGLYIPGGTAPLFSTLLMLGIPAKLAGCREIVLCSPPDPQGRLHPAILYAAKLVGVTKIYKAGGVQAIAAMAYGTETIPAVYKIFGPGNQYVTCAKQLIQKDGVAIDMPAGPSEVAVYADDSAHPGFVAADLLSQAEHGPDSQVVLACPSRQVAERVLEAVQQQVIRLPRAEVATKALAFSRAFITRDAKQAMEILNEYAPEHLILACDNAAELAEKVVNAGSVFIGHFSPESAGDYASGTNHVLPTNGYARAYSGVSLDSFVKKITFQQLTQEGIRGIGPAVIQMAEAEGLRAHADAVRVRVS